MKGFFLIKPCLYSSTQHFGMLCLNLIQMNNLVYSFELTSLTLCKGAQILQKCSKEASDPESPEFHFLLQCIDAVGFCLFLKTYLDVEDFPADFCQRLFRYFQHAEKDGSTKTPLPRGGNCFECVIT